MELPSFLLPENIDLIKKTIAKDATTQELALFIHICKQYNLDPLLKEIFFTKYNNKVTIMASRDGYLKVANSNPMFDGIESDAVYEGDILTKRDDGSILITYGAQHMTFDKSKLLGAFCNVFRKDRSKAVSTFVSLKDYKKTSDVWSMYTGSMIIKVAESHALKRAFSLSGLVAKEEMSPHQEDNISEFAPKSTEPISSIESSSLSDAQIDWIEKQLSKEEIMSLLNHSGLSSLGDFLKNDFREIVEYVKAVKGTNP